MRKVFIDAYGFELDFAGFYYSTARFIPNHSGEKRDWILNVCWHIVPEGRKKVVQTTTYPKNTYSEKPYENIYDQSGRGVLFQILKTVKSGKFKKIDEI